MRADTAGTSLRNAHIPQKYARAHGISGWNYCQRVAGSRFVCPRCRNRRRTVLALLTAEQELLQKTVSDLSASFRLAAPREIADIDRARYWATLSEAGVLGLRIRDAEGRPVASGVEVMLVAEVLGRALAPLPYLGTAVLAAELLSVAGAPDDWLQDLSGGTVRYAPVLTSDLSRLACLSDFPDVVAFDADDATYGLTVAESSNQLVRLRLEQNWVDVGSADLTRTLLRPDFQAPLDGGVELAGKPLATDDLDRWLALALVTLAADAAGAMRQGMQDAVEYSKVRVQYGVPIGSFQAIQHLCADMLVQVASTTSAINYAAWAVDELEPKEALLAARVAKAYSSMSAMNISETVMQIYGGIGQTWEHIAHFVTRRTLLDRHVFGDAPHQFRAIADLRLDNSREG